MHAHTRLPSRSPSPVRGRPLAGPTGQQHEPVQDLPILRGPDAEGARPLPAHDGIAPVPVDAGLEPPSGQTTPDQWTQAFVNELNQATEPGAQVDIPALLLQQANRLQQLRQGWPDAAVSRGSLDEIDGEVMPAVTLWFTRQASQPGVPGGNLVAARWVEGMVAINLAWKAMPVQGGVAEQVTGDLFADPLNYVAARCPVPAPPQDSPGARSLKNWLEVYRNECAPETGDLLHSLVSQFIAPIEQLAAEGKTDLRLRLPPSFAPLNNDRQSGALRAFRKAVAVAFPGVRLHIRWRK